VVFPATVHWSKGGGELVAVFCSAGRQVIEIRICASHERTRPSGQSPEWRGVLTVSSMDPVPRFIPTESLMICDFE